MRNFKTTLSCLSWRIERREEGKDEEKGSWKRYETGRRRMVKGSWKRYKRGKRRMVRRRESERGMRAREGKMKRGAKRKV